jgi:hypothetical protein
VGRVVVVVMEGEEEMEAVVEDVEGKFDLPSSEFVLNERS